VLTSYLHTDIKALTVDDGDIIKELGPAFEKYNKEQFTTVKLPGSSQPVIVSSFNELGDGRFFDVESATSFDFDHVTQVLNLIRGSFGQCADC
jgi:capping protein (actin filament) muscle Z-line, alpha